MRKENLKRKGVDDADNASDNEERETSPGAADNGDDDAEVKNAANDNTEENGDAKELGTDEEFVDAENDEDKDKEKGKNNGNEGENGEDDNGEEEEKDDVPLKKSGRGKPKPAKKAAAAEGNGDAKANGDDKEKDEEKEEGGEEAEDAEEDDAGEDKNDDGSDFESAPKKGKKGAGKRAAPKKKEMKKAAKPKPAKKTKKQEIEEEEEEEDEDVEYEVQDIVDHRKERGGKMVYRIRWKNFGAKDDTWEPEATLSCPDIIKRYKAKLAEKEKEEEEEEDVEYEVEDIIDHRKERGGKMVYRIRWKNFKAADDTWEPEATLTCPDIIKRYKAKLDKEDSAPPAKKGKPAPKGAAGKKGKKAAPKPSPKKRSAKESEEEDDDEDEEGDGAEYEVEKIIEVHFKRNGKRDYLVRWKGFSAKDDTWEPEEHLNCKDLIAKFNEKLDKSKSATVKELRVNRKPTERLHLVEIGRKTSRRNAGKARVNYYDGE